MKINSSFLALLLVIFIFTFSLGMAVGPLIHGHPATKVTADGKDHLQEYIDHNQFSAPAHYKCGAGQCINSFTGGGVECITIRSYSKGGETLGYHEWTVDAPSLHTITWENGGLSSPDAPDPGDPYVPPVDNGTGEPAGQSTWDFDNDGEADAWDDDDAGVPTAWDLDYDGVRDGLFSFSYGTQDFNINFVETDGNYDNLNFIYINRMPKVNKFDTNNDGLIDQIDILDGSERELTNIQWELNQFPRATYAARDGTTTQVYLIDDPDFLEYEVMISDTYRSVISLSGYRIMNLQAQTKAIRRCGPYDEDEEDYGIGIDIYGSNHVDITNVVWSADEVPYGTVTTAGGQTYSNVGLYGTTGFLTGVYNSC